MISFIISAYDRPKSLAVILASISTQTEPHEAIVCCNSVHKPFFDQNKAVAKQFGAQFYPTVHWGAFCGYSSAEMVIAKKIPKGDWLAFPCDDTIYVQGFSDIMLRNARDNNWDLVYCDMVNDPMDHPGVRGWGRYGHVKVTPRLGQIGKDGFLIRAGWFNGFPGKVFGGPTGSDGLLIREAVRRGIRHGKAPGILMVHQ